MHPDHFRKFLANLLPPLSLLCVISGMVPGYCDTTSPPQTNLGNGVVKYTIVELVNFVPFAMNNKGQIIGDDTGGSDVRMERSSTLLENGQIRHFLPPAEQPESMYGNSYVATALNDKQQIIVILFTRSFEGWGSEAFLWRKNVLEKITPPSNSQFNFNDVIPTAINSQGCMAGYVSNRQKSFMAADEKYTEIACLIRGDKILLIGPQVVATGETQAAKHSEAKAINDQGHIVGTVQEWRKLSHGFIWKQNVFTDIGEGSAVAINNEDHIAGWYEGISRKRMACLWIDNVRRDIGIGQANSINDQDQVVGNYDTDHSARHAFLWDNGKFIDLNDFLPKGSPDVFENAIQINQRGQILVDGFITGKRGSHSFLLTPIHTPKTKP